MNTHTPINVLAMALTEAYDTPEKMIIGRRDENKKKGFFLLLSLAIFSEAENHLVRFNTL